MSRIKRARPALVVVLALIAAMAGTAIASSGPDANTSASAKKTAQKALAKAKKALAKAKQVEKQEGPKGETGDQGPAGPQGTDGAPDPGIQLARVNSLPIDDSVVYAAPSGTSTPDANREQVAAALPAGDPVDPADLSVVLSAAPGPGNSRTVHLAWITPGGGQNINPSCTISGNETACSFAGSSPSSNNALLAIRLSGTGSPVAAEAAVGYRLVPE